MFQDGCLPFIPVYTYVHSLDPTIYLNVKEFLVSSQCLVVFLFSNCYLLNYFVCLFVCFVNLAISFPFFPF